MLAAHANDADNIYSVIIWIILYQQCIIIKKS